MFVKPRQNLFVKLREQQELHEADGDARDIMNTQVDQNTTNTDPNAGEAESTSDDDLNVDTDLDNLDDPMTTGDENQNNDDNLDMGGDDMGNDNMMGDDSGSTDAGSSSNTEGEVKKGNTDLFASLSAEEQSIKIMELKRLYNELYISTDDFIDKLNSMYMENIDPRIIVRITSQMEELRRMIQDYIIDSFNIKTYYENDVQYSIFLSMFITVREIFDDINKYNNQNQGKNS